MLSVRDGRLYVEDVPCVALAERFGTPLFVVSEDQLRRNARSFAGAFQERWPEGPVRILPSLKANYTLALRHVLSRRGWDATRSARRSSTLPSERTSQRSSSPSTALPRARSSSWTRSRPARGSRSTQRASC